jgi:hypothetical protein
LAALLRIRNTKNYHFCKKIFFGICNFLFLCKIFSENLNKYFNLFFDTTRYAKVKMIFAAAAAYVISWRELANPLLRDGE